MITIKAEKATKASQNNNKSNDANEKMNVNDIFFLYS